MNHKVAAKWIKALRSNKYQQGFEYLCHVDSKGKKRYSCLGVLCEVLKAPFNIKYNYKRYYGSIEALPKEILLQSGMKTEFGRLEDPKLCLIELNDEGESFIELANLIENNVDKF